MRRINKLINRGILPWSDPIIRYFFILTFSHNQNLRKECVSVNKENWHFKQLSDKLVHSVPSISVGLWGLKIYSVTNLTWLLKSFNSLCTAAEHFAARHDNTDRVTNSQVANSNYVFYALQLTTFWSFAVYAYMLYTYLRLLRLLNDVIIWSPPCEKINTLCNCWLL